jgi:hypothetical protein
MNYKISLLTFVIPLELSRPKYLVESNGNVMAHGGAQEGK